MHPGGGDGEGRASSTCLRHAAGEEKVVDAAAGDLHLSGERGGRLARAILDVAQPHARLLLVALSVAAHHDRPLPPARARPNQLRSAAKRARAVGAVDADDAELRRVEDEHLDQPCARRHRTC